MTKRGAFIISICGVRLVDAPMVLQCHPTMIGLIFVPNTPRQVDMREATFISKLAHGAGVLVKGVFQNRPLEEVIKLSHELRLDYIQLHGNEDAAYCSALPQKVIKTIRLEQNGRKTRVLVDSYRQVVDLFLLDRPHQGKGAMLPLFYVKKVAKEYPILLAGGLNPGNVGAVIARVGNSLHGVDVSSGVEMVKGRKDSSLVDNFISQAQEAYEQL